MLCKSVVCLRGKHFTLVELQNEVDGRVQAIPRPLTALVRTLSLSLHRVASILQDCTPMSRTWSSPKPTLLTGEPTAWHMLATKKNAFLTRVLSIIADVISSIHPNLEPNKHASAWGRCRLWCRKVCTEMHLLKTPHLLVVYAFLWAFPLPGKLPLWLERPRCPYDPMLSWLS
jgi:hypothetical protein